MHISEILGLSAAERQARQQKKQDAHQAEMGRRYHQDAVDTYHAQWIRGQQDGRYSTDATGFEAYKQMLIKNYPPKSTELVSTADPVAFDNNTIYRWTDQALKEKNAIKAKQAAAKQPTAPETGSQQPSTQQPANQPTATSSTTQQSATTTQTQPSAQPTKQVQPGQEIEFPGTNYKFKYSPSWMDAEGKPASEAAAKVLSQLAAGKTGADLDRNELRDARRSMGLLESKKRQGAIL